MSQAETLAGDARRARSDRRTSRRCTRSRRRSRSGRCSRSRSSSAASRARHRRRLERGARRPARRPRRRRDRLHDLAVRPEVRRCGRCLRVPHARRPPLGRRPHRRLLLHRRAVPRRRRYLPRARDPERQLLEGAHLRQRARLVDLGNDRARDRPRPQLLRRQARDQGDADVRGRLVRPDADPRARDHLQGRREREHADHVRPRPDLALRDHRRRRARRDPARHPPLRRIRGGGVDRRGVRGSTPLDPTRADRDRRGGGRVLRLHVVRVLDRLRQEGGQRGRLGVLAERRRRHGDEVRRLTGTQRCSRSSSSSTRWRSRSRSAS